VEIAEIDTTSIPEPSAVVGNLVALLSLGMYFAWSDLRKINQVIDIHPAVERRGFLSLTV
jgi:hypothetical protein